jgi:ferrous-iron efflux pump FieF
MGLHGLDPWFGIAIALYIFYSAGQIGRTAIAALMDRELPDAEREAIKEIVRGTPGVLSIHGLRTWQSGRRKVVQMHIELDAELSLIEAHRISVAVEKALLVHDPDTDITIHEDPQGYDRELTNPGDHYL